MPEQSEAAPVTAEMLARSRQYLLDRAPARLAQLYAAVDDAGAFTHLPSAAAAAFHLGRFGNAIHRGHTVLGLLAVNVEDYSLAVDELHKAGDTPGSPQLNSFGPTMQLAAAVLRFGEVAPVLTYLDRCRIFWETGASWLDLWEKMVRDGRVPNFFQHSFV